METTRLDLARYTLGLIGNDSLPDVAAQALLDGYDSPSLRILVGQSTEASVENSLLLQRSLGELGLKLPDHDSAMEIVARSVALRIVQGHLTPKDGAKLINDDLTGLAVPQNGYRFLALPKEVEKIAKLSCVIEEADDLYRNGIIDLNRRDVIEKEASAEILQLARSTVKL